MKIVAYFSNEPLCLRLKRHSFEKKQIFEKSWEYGKDILACFVDLEKAYDRVPRDKLWKVLQEYGVDGQLLRTIKPFYCRPEVCVRVNGKQSKPSKCSVPCGRWTPAKVRFVTSPFHCLHELDRQKWAKLMSVPRLETAKSVVCLLFADYFVRLSST